MPPPLSSITLTNATPDKLQCSLSNYNSKKTYWKPDTGIPSAHRPKCFGTVTQLLTEIYTPSSSHLSFFLSFSSQPSPSSPLSLPLYVTEVPRLTSHPHSTIHCEGSPVTSHLPPLPPFLSLSRPGELREKEGEWVILYNSYDSRLVTGLRLLRLREKDWC